MIAPHGGLEIPSGLSGRCAGGFVARAAEELNGPRATVRRQVDGLEAQLGVQLFRRSAGGPELSAPGRKLLPQAIEAELALRQGFCAVRGLDSEAAGRLRLSADPMTAHFLPAPVPGEFLSLYPDICIDMALSCSVDPIERLETDVSIHTALRYGVTAIAILLFLVALRRSGERAGRLRDGGS